MTIHFQAIEIKLKFSKIIIKNKCGNAKREVGTGVKYI